MLTKARELFDAAIESFLGSQFGFFPLYKRYKPESNQQFRAETPADDPTPTFQKAIDDLLKVSAQCKCIASSFSIQAVCVHFRVLLYFVIVKKDVGNLVRTGLYQERISRDKYVWNAVILPGNGQLCIERRNVWMPKK